MHVIRPTRNGRAQVIRRDVPLRDAVVASQQGPIQRFDGFRIGEIDGKLSAVRGRRYERREARATFDELLEDLSGRLKTFRRAARAGGGSLKG